MVKNIIITILIVIILCLIGNWHYNKMYDAYGGDLVAEKCPVCEVCPDNRITVERIIRDNPTIELPDELIQFKYKGEEYTKVMLDEAKLKLEVK